MNFYFRSSITILYRKNIPEISADKIKRAVVLRPVSVCESEYRKHVRIGNITGYTGNRVPRKWEISLKNRVDLLLWFMEKKIFSPVRGGGGVGYVS